MSGTEERIARNQALWRDVNENAEAAATRLRMDPGKPARFLCECGDETCAELIEMPLAVYEAVRAHARRFVVCPAHIAPSVEHLVEWTDGFAIVEKDAPAAVRIVEESDPRA